MAQAVMPYPHVIRLRGPWDFELLDCEQDKGNGGALRARGRVTLPASWGNEFGADFLGRVRYRRRFNRPTGLDPHLRVWLVIDGVDAHGACRLNGHELSPIDGYALRAACDVTNDLAPANVLEVDVERTPDEIRPGRERLPGGLIGEARLEIRTPWQIDDLALYWSDSDRPTLCVRGVVPAVGGHPPANDPQLIVSACNRELMCEAVAAGAQFEFARTIDGWPQEHGEPAPTPVDARLLVDGQTCWRATLPTAPPRADAHDPPADFTTAGGASPVWLDYLELESAELAEVVQHLAGRVIGSRAVQPDLGYTQFDYARIGVVQQLPIAWAARVAPRLAHHRSIIAWGATPAELAAISPADLAGISFGRPWIAC